MLTTMKALDARGRLAVLLASPQKARPFSVPRLLQGGKVGDAAALAALAALAGQVTASGIGAQVGEIEAFLRLHPSTLARLRLYPVRPRAPSGGERLRRRALPVGAAGAASRPLPPAALR